MASQSNFGTRYGPGGVSPPQQQNNDSMKNGTPDNSNNTPAITTEPLTAANTFSPLDGQAQAREAKAPSAREMTQAARQLEKQYAVHRSLAAAAVASQQGELPFQAMQDAHKRAAQHSDVKPVSPLSQAQRPAVKQSAFESDTSFIDNVLAPRQHRPGNFTYTQADHSTLPYSIRIPIRDHYPNEVQAVGQPVADQPKTSDSSFKISCKRSSGQATLDKASSSSSSNEATGPPQPSHAQPGDAKDKAEAGPSQQAKPRKVTHFKVHTMHDLMHDPEMDQRVYGMDMAPVVGKDSPQGRLERQYIKTAQNITPDADQKGKEPVQPSPFYFRPPYTSQPSAAAPAPAVPSQPKPFACSEYLSQPSVSSLSRAIEASYGKNQALIAAHLQALGRAGEQAQVQAEAQAQKAGSEADKATIADKSTIAQLQAEIQTLKAASQADKVTIAQQQLQTQRLVQARMMQEAMVAQQNSSSQPRGPEAAPAQRFPPAQAPTSRPHQPQSASAVFLDHSRAPRISTDTVITRAIRTQYPNLQLTVVQEYNCQLLAFAAAGHAIVKQLADTDATPAAMAWKAYAPPARRLDGGSGALGEQPIFAKYSYRWNDHEFIVYFFDGRDGANSYPMIRNYYILSAKTSDAHDLILAAGKWSDDLHEEILVFDQGTWTKSKELYASVRGAKWENVILDEEMKKAVIEDHLSFFRSRDTYTGLKVPWKRGIIYYGPPGNGKTISIKATMNMLYRQTPEIPTLYVRTLVSYMGPEFSIRQIFAAARRYAPCYLVFEDLDTIVSDNVRSYFLNEVDGLKNNDGIFMVGSTNHLDRLDPGISKRPSRFDRKYFFPDPNHEQRVAYCHFWQKKLGDSDDIEFPDKLCGAIADITDKFSFAYMQEAFVAALLAIASKREALDGDMPEQPSMSSESEIDEFDEEGRPASPGARSTASARSGEDWVGVDSDDDCFHDEDGSDDEEAAEDDETGEEDNENDNDGDDGDDDDLDKYVLWVELKKQIAILREGIEDEDSVV